MGAGIPAIQKANITVRKRLFASMTLISDILRLLSLLRQRRTATAPSSRISSAVDAVVADLPLPILTFTGTSFECGRRYAQWVMGERPEHIHRLLHSAWASPCESEIKTLFKEHARPALLFSEGIASVIGGHKTIPTRYSGINSDQAASPGADTECTSFSVSPRHTLCGQTISGQTKDTDVTSLSEYILLRLRPIDAPPIAVLTYPGELLGYGLWGTGMSLFRNSIHCAGSSPEGLDFHQFGLLSLSQTRTSDIRALGRKLQIKGKGNLLITDVRGDAISIEFNGAGKNILEPGNGILTHANHCEGSVTATLSKYSDPVEEKNSLFRSSYLREQIEAGSPTLTPQRIYSILSDHVRYPRGICRHQIGQSVFKRTTATVIAENSTLTLNVSLGNPCMSWPTSIRLLD